MTGMTEQQRKEYAALVAQNDATNSGSAEDWRLAASLWRIAGYDDKYAFCLAMAEDIEQ